MFENMTVAGNHISANWNGSIAVSRFGGQNHRAYFPRKSWNICLFPSNRLGPPNPRGGSIFYKGIPYKSPKITNENSPLISHPKTPLKSSFTPWHCVSKLPAFRYCINTSTSVNSWVTHQLQNYNHNMKITVSGVKIESRWNKSACTVWSTTSIGDLVTTQTPVVLTGAPANASFIYEQQFGPVRRRVC